MTVCPKNTLVPTSSVSILGQLKRGSGLASSPTRYTLRCGTSGIDKDAGYRNEIMDFGGFYGIGVKYFRSKFPSNRNESDRSVLR